MLIYQYRGFAAPVSTNSSDAQQRDAYGRTRFFKTPAHVEAHVDWLLVPYDKWGGGCSAADVSHMGAFDHDYDYPWSGASKYIS